jgi:Ca2+-binding RTX toxin-like protein
MLTNRTAHLALTTFVAAAVAAVTAGFALAGNIAPNPPTCEGKPVTILGTAAADFIAGSPGPDVILGGDGNDVIRGLGGNDTICGGRDDDDIYGEAGNDIVYGGPGDDRLSGMNGFDWLNGQDGNDHVRGGASSDTLVGEAGNDRLDAVVNDTGVPDDVEGGSGNDRVLTRDGVAGDFGSAGADADFCTLDAGDPVASC